MNYPLLSDYIEAIKAAEDNFDQLKHLSPVLGEDGEPVMTSGNFAVVFKMKNEQTGKLHAVKCFLREQEGRAEAYRQIAEELEYVSSTFLTPIKYLDKELFVDTNASDDTEFPVLLMDWVEGDTLDKYIRKHLDDQYELSLLAYQFSRLAMWLMPQPFAHGDLKPDNILVKSDGTLVLVDYDGMYVPAMKGQRARELGSPDFRHPSRTESDFDEHIDDFSLASILLSLKAISLQPSLLEEYGAQDRLLFSEKDYRNLSESEVLNTLRPLMLDTELASLYSLLILAISQKNLSQVSFRLFNLSRPKEPEMTEEDYEAWIREIEADYEQSQYEKQYQDWIEECLNESNKENLWPLLTFARQHGKMRVGEFANKESGDKFKSCIFTKNGVHTFVAFSATIGELTPKEIAAMKDELVVVQYENGNYSLCKRNDYDDTKDIKTRLCSKGNIVNRKLRVKSPNGQFGIIDVKERYMEGSRWRVKYDYYNIKENNQYNISDIHSIEYNRDNDLLKISFNQVLDNGYNNICFSRLYGKVHMEFYRYHILVNELDSRFNKASLSLEELFYAFCSLSQLESKNAIVTLNGEAFQVTYIQNFYTETEMRNMDPLESVHFIYDVIDKKNPSTEVIDADLANAWTDEFGVKYSADKKYLIEGPVEETKKGIHIWKKGVLYDSYNIHSDTVAICDKAFFDCRGLTSIKCPKSLQTIGKCAFQNCWSLKEVNLNYGLLEICDYAFKDCKGLKSINIPGSISYVASNAFEGSGIGIIYTDFGDVERVKTMLPQYGNIIIEELPF